MVRACTVAIVALSLLIASANSAPTQVATATAGVSKSETQRVDQLFSKWAKPDSPGAVVAVIENGAIIYSRGYGLASLEYDVPNAPTTVFHMASISKQFTALAIYLLALDGKLSLDDDVRKYLPELHQFDETITIRQLLHHTSGLRDQWSLLALAGWRLEDVITEQDILDLIWRQTDLNFSPGDQYLYSNTGYTLLGLIVKRVSGIPLSAFAKERIFEPLGMTHTHFQDDYGTVVKHRAFSYAPSDDGKYKYVALSYSTVGPSSLFTTVEDLAKWDQNFYTGQVGGKSLLAQMQTKGMLNSGKEISYASGLIVDEYRGLKTVWHNGGDAGYRTNILRFPDERFSVIILANAADLDPTALSLRIADIFLTDKFAVPSAAAPSKSVPKATEIKIDPKVLDAYVGKYQLTPYVIITFTRDGDQLFAQVTGQAKYPVFPSSKSTFFWKTVDAYFTFDKTSEGGQVMGGVHHQFGGEFPAKRIVEIPLNSDQVNGCQGEFYSDELGVIYTITYEDGVLMVRYPRGNIPLTQTSTDNFLGKFPIGRLEFSRGQDGACNGLTIDDGRVQKLRFSKVAIRPSQVP